MYKTLLETFRLDLPDLVVVDRFSFAGFDVSHRLGIPYAVNSPYLLQDLDSPPSHIPAPYSGFPLSVREFNSTETGEEEMETKVVVTQHIAGPQQWEGRRKLRVEIMPVA